MRKMFFDIATAGLEVYSPIAAISVRINGKTYTRITREYGGDNDLAEMLRRAWDVLFKHNTADGLIVGYGITGFDIPVISFHSMVLGVIPPRPATQLHVLDLMKSLSFWRSAKYSSLADVASKIGMDVPKWDEAILADTQSIAEWQDKKLVAIEALFERMNKIYFYFQEDENDDQVCS